MCTGFKKGLAGSQPQVLREREDYRPSEHGTTAAPKLEPQIEIPGPIIWNGPAAATRSDCLENKTLCEFSCHANVNFL